MKFATRFKLFGAALTLASFPGMLGFVVALLSPMLGFGAFFGGLVLMLPLAAVYAAKLFYEKSRDEKGRIAFQAFVVAAAGEPPRALAYKRSSGVAVAGNLVLFSADGVHQSYPSADVRSWKIYIEEANTLQSSGVQQSFAHYGTNVTRLMEAWLNTGLFVNVKDVTTPVWQVRFGKAELVEARRWVEILNQAVNGDTSKNAA